MKKIFRKIHLWLSVPFGIFITLICFSGAMLVFEKEITELCRHDLYFVKEVKEKPLPIDSLMQRVSATLPDSVAVSGVTVSPDAERTWQVSLSKPRRASLYVDPYTGEVTGRSERLPFYDTMFHLHRWMLGSSQGFGKLLVGISTLMLVIILITGILMWLTNRKKPLRKSLTISFTKGWPRFWHDLHVAGGIYATIFLLAIALTGLTWSFAWYRTGFYGMFGVEASAGGHGGHGGSGGRTADGEASHGRNGRHGRPENRRDNLDIMRTEHDSTNAGSTENCRDRHRHDGDGGRDSRPARREAVPEPATTQSESAAPSEPENNRQLAEETPERPRDNEDGTERRGRHGRGGRGRYHHEGDSIGGYARHHRPDSLRPHVTEQETAVAENRPDDSAQPSDADKTASTRRRNGRGRQENGERREPSRGNRPVRTEARQADAVSVPTDTVATAPRQPQVSPFAHWQEVYDVLAKSHPGYRQITLSEGSASVVPAGRNSLRAGDRFDFDTESGKITGSTPYADQDKSTHVRSAVYTVHVGSWGGLLTRIITFLAVLLGATLPLTGYYLWIRRLHGKSKHNNQRPKA